MPHFGARSESRLATVDPDIVKVLRDAIEIYDFTIVCGHRDETAQNEAYANGYSKVRYPMSQHNSFPSNAVDVAPWNRGIDWQDTHAFSRLFGIIEACAHRRGVRLRWGGDFDNDGRTRDSTFLDFGHIELR